MRPAVLELSEVRTSGDERALSALELVVGEGDAVAVLGLPGSGKTSLVRLLAGLDAVAGGTMTLFGADLTKVSYRAARALRDRVAVVFERGGIWSNRSVLENLVLPVACRTNASVRSFASDPELLALLDALGLGGAVHRETDSLDDSERRRVLYVRALYTKPDLLIVDEPRAALSRAQVRAVAALIGTIRAERMLSIVYTDGDGRLEPFDVDRPVVLHERRIVPGAVRLPERGAFLPGPPESVRSSSRLSETFGSGGPA